MSTRVSRVNRKETPPALHQQAEKKSEKEDIENTCELNIEEIMNYGASEKQEVSGKQTESAADDEYTHVNLSVIKVLDVVITVAVLILCVLYGNHPISSRKTETQAPVETPSAVPEYQFTDEDRALIFNAVEARLNTSFGADGYQHFQPADMKLEGTHDKCRLACIPVRLTKADNSPTLILDFELTFNAETGQYDAGDYVIVESQTAPPEATEEAVEQSPEAVEGTVPEAPAEVEG